MHEHDDEPIDLSRLHERDFWEERYSGPAHVWSGRPNPAVLAEVADLTPGRALDVAAGEGGDAIWLAEHGWSVTALDVAENALDRGRAAARLRGVADRVTWVRADARAWRTDERFDLVTSAYLHLPAGVLEHWLDAVTELVTPGGTLVVVGHDASDQHTVERHPQPELYAEPADLAARLDADVWEVVTAGARSYPATGPDGETSERRDAVLRARRR